MKPDSVHALDLIVVLGMHRSGTSAITRGLEVLGVELGGNLIPPAVNDNAKGFFEDRDIVDFNISLLNDLCMDWHHAAPVTDFQVEDLCASGYLIKAESLIRKKIAAKGLYGIKDPRLSKLMPFWKKVFERCEFNVGYVIAIRNPISVAKSLKTRDGFSFEKSYLLWLDYTLSAIIHTDGCNRVALDFDRVLENPSREIYRLAEAFDLTVKVDAMLLYTREFLDKKLRHNIAQPQDVEIDSIIPPIARNLYAAVRESALVGTHLCISPEQLAFYKNARENFNSSFVFIDQQIKEIHRLNVAYEDKDAALARVSAELQRVGLAYEDKDAALARVSAELQRVGLAYEDRNIELAHMIDYIKQLQSSHIRLQQLAKSIKKWPKLVRHYLLKTEPKRARIICNIEMPSDLANAPQNGKVVGWAFSEDSDSPILAIRLSRGKKQFLGRTLMHRPDVELVYPNAGSFTGFEINYDIKRPGSYVFKLEALLPVGLWHRCSSMVIRVSKPDSNKSESATPAYQIKIPKVINADRPRIVHAMANFMVGGSSRLVVDLVEHLGGNYEQVVLTSLSPKPAAYCGIDVAEIKLSAGYEAFLSHLSQMRVDFVHIHYWGECDEPWYSLVFKAAESLGVPVIQNINTPVDPYISNAVWKNVYVSNTVLREFGNKYEKSKECVVYPGSDFTLFTRPNDDHIPDNCIGMVCRLECDKLNEDSIAPFIRCVQLRPGTRVLIVGGGSLLASFKAAVEIAGLSDAFEFTGYVSYQELPHLYRRMSLFVAPVWKESFGQVSPFAMHMRVPVVGYAVGAIPEIVDDPELVAPAGDSEALASLMVALLEDRPRRLNIGERHAERASKIFSVEGMINHYRSLYEEITKISK